MTFVLPFSQQSRRDSEGVGPVRESVAALRRYFVLFFLRAVPDGSRTCNDSVINCPRLALLLALRACLAVLCDQVLQCFNFSESSPIRCEWVAFLASAIGFDQFTAKHVQPWTSITFHGGTSVRVRTKLRNHRQTKGSGLNLRMLVSPEAEFEAAPAWKMPLFELPPAIQTDEGLLCKHSRLMQIWPGQYACCVHLYIKFHALNCWKT